MVAEPLKSLLRPKSIILTQVGSPFSSNIKFSGLMSLSSIDQMLGEHLPVGDVVVVEVHESTEQLLHDQSCLLLGQVLPLKDKVEKLASLAISIFGLILQFTYSSTRKHTSFHSQISCSFII